MTVSWQSLGKSHHSLRYLHILFSKVEEHNSFLFVFLFIWNFHPQILHEIDAKLKEEETGMCMSIFIYMMSSRHSERHACMYMSMQSRCYSICSPKFVLQVKGIGNFSKGSLHMVPNLLNTCTPQIHRWTRDYLSIYWVSVDLRLSVYRALTLFARGHEFESRLRLILCE